MKRILPGLKAGLVMGLSVCTWGAQAAHPLLRAVFQSSNNTGSHLSITPSVSNRSYPNAGIRLLDSRDTVSGCTVNPKNGFCLFPLSSNAATKLPIRPHGFHRSSGAMHFELSLNAAGTHPVSRQVFTTSSTPGRMIGYTYGWEPTIPAADIAAAGYTHVLIAFGLFTDTGGGVSLGALSGSGYGQPDDLFNYIQSLHNAGVKVLLSIGGASTNIPGTTVSLFTAELGAGDPQTFQDNFIAALQALSNTYGFDGFDIDIEDGLYAGNGSGDPATDFLDPSIGCSMSGTPLSQCTSYYLSNIINTLYTQNFAWSGERFLISLAPQLPQISATSTYNSIFGLYSAIVMQTYASLEWVAFQNYNSGCAFGIDGICYPTDGTTLTSSPDSAVAFATTLLESWPQGTPSAFLPYTSYLTPSQVAIGYVVNNVSGVADGSPAVDTTVAKNAIQCLRTHEACGTYIPPNTYPDIGGVFSWTINYDATNGYQFAKALYPCIVNGNCS